MTIKQRTRQPWPDDAVPSSSTIEAFLFERWKSSIAANRLSVGAAFVLEEVAAAERFTPLYFASRLVSPAGFMAIFELINAIFATKLRRDDKENLSKNVRDGAAWSGKTKLRERESCSREREEKREGKKEKGETLCYIKNLSRNLLIPNKMSTTGVIRRVRLELPLEIPSPHAQHLAALPYEVWLRGHLDEVKALRGPRGGILVPRALSRKSATSNTFVTDFHFASVEDVEYYNRTYRDVMRGRVTEAYPLATQEGSPFRYTIAMSTDVSKDAFEAVGDLEEPQLIEMYISHNYDG
jgi:hypothetical protein